MVKALIIKETDFRFKLFYPLFSPRILSLCAKNLNGFMVKEVIFM